MQATIIPLNEGYYTIGFDKVFHSFDPAKDKLEERSRGSLLVEIQPFLIKTASQNILIDAGLGFINEDTGNLRIEDNLTKQGLRLRDITDVVMSHLHKDHAGGLFHRKNDHWVTTFENAVHHINLNEYHFALDEKNALSYDLEKLKQLHLAADLQWMENGLIFDFMQYMEDGGHCPHHTSFLMNFENGKYFFGGDVAPQLKQLKYRYMAKYDFDSRKSAALRDEYANRGLQEDWIFMFYHDVSIPMAKLKND